MTENYLYVHQVAHRLKLHETTVYRLIREGKLRAVRVSKRVLRVPEAAFSDYVKEYVVDTDEDLRAE